MSVTLCPPWCTAPHTGDDVHFGPLVEVPFDGAGTVEMHHVRAELDQEITGPARVSLWVDLGDNPLISMPPATARAVAAMLVELADQAEGGQTTKG